MISRRKLMDRLHKNNNLFTTIQMHLKDGTYHKNHILKLIEDAIQENAMYWIRLDDNKKVSRFKKRRVTNAPTAIR